MRSSYTRVSMHSNKVTSSKIVCDVREKNIKTGYSKYKGNFNHQSCELIFFFARCRDYFRLMEEYRIKNSIAVGQLKNVFKKIKYFFFLGFVTCLKPS